MSEQSACTTRHALPTLLSLPYDIRYLIYQNLFPSGSHVAILAWGDSIKAYVPRGHNQIPVHLLRTCRLLHAEAGAFLYTQYVFNFFGTKDDCLGVFTGFRRVMERYVQDQKVRVQALSNGPHSSTGGICLGVSDAKMELVRQRGRGRPVEIDELKRETGVNAKPYGDTGSWSGISTMLAAAIAILSISIALWLYG